MVKIKRKKTQIDAWESGEYGLDEAFIKVTDAAEAAEVDGALDLKMISIRLQNDLIKKLKLIAKYHGIGYQSLIRTLLQRFTRGELMQIAMELEEIEKIEQTLEAEDSRPKEKSGARVKDYAFFGMSKNPERTLPDELENLRKPRHDL